MKKHLAEKHPRRPKKGGYARGDETRLQIVETALDMFGQGGFEKTSTRAIADRAGVNLGSITYYFGSKKGLYRACAEHIATYGEKASEALLAEIEKAVSDQKLRRADLLALLRSYVAATTEQLVSKHDPQSWLLFMDREQTNPAIASDIVYRRVTQPLVHALAGLVGRIIGRSATDPETVIRTLAIVGQLIVFRRMRIGALRALGWPDFQSKRGSTLKEVLWDQIESGLETGSESGGTRDLARR